MIAIIDMNSDVRRECYHMLSSEHISVAVFYSAMTFVGSGALYEAGLLALGKTRSCRTNCEMLRWASEVRPDLRTLLLNPLRLCIRPLLEVCNDPSDRLAENDWCVSLDAFRQARNLGLLRCPSRLSDQSYAKSSAASDFTPLQTWDFLDEIVDARRRAPVRAAPPAVQLSTWRFRERG
jgi:hypothetical protein